MNPLGQVWQMDLLCQALAIGIMNLALYCCIDAISRMLTDGTSAIRQTFAYVMMQVSLAFTCIGYAVNLDVFVQLFCCIDVPGFSAIILNGLLVFSLWANAPLLIHFTYLVRCSVREHKAAAEKLWQTAVDHHRHPYGCKWVRKNAHQ